MEYNNCSNTSNISGSVEEYLQQLQDTSNITMVPALIMLVLFAVTGLVGNILVLVVYSQKMKLTPTKVLIMTIASFDLVANVGAIPIAITTMLDTWNFSMPGVCKCTVFLGSFTAVGGAISLLVVAVVRYRKVCKPYGWQVTINQAIITSMIIFLVAFIISIPYFIIYGMRTIQTPCPKIQGHDCFADDDYFFTIWPFLNNMLFVLVYLSLSVSIVVLYIFIGVTAWRHSRLHGIPAEATKTLNDDAARTAGTQGEKEEMHSRGDDPNSKVTKEYSKKSLFCCTDQEHCEVTKDDTSSSIVMKTLPTTTTTETEDNDSQLVKHKENVAINITTPKMEAPLAQLAHSFASTNQQLQNDVMQETNMFQRTDRRHSNNYRRLRAGSLLDDTTGEDTSHPELPNKIAESSLTPISTPARKQPASTSLGNAKKGIKHRALGRMTAMLIIISTIYVLGFLPFLILTVYKNKLPERYANLNMVELTFYNLFYRLYFLNSAANPIIYSLCDLNFRRQCIRLLTCQSRRSF